MEVIIRPRSTYEIETKNISIPYQLGDSGGTYGLSRTGQILWNGAILLSKILEYNPPCILMNCRVLELGCGCCALPGQVAAIFGAHVTVADVAEEVNSISQNIHQNSTLHTHPITVAELDWNRVRSEHSFPEHLNPTQFDLVLCGDLVYEVTMIPLMYTLLLLFFHHPQILVLMSNTNRKHVHLFRRKMSSFCNFDTTSYNNINDRQNVSDVVWLITLKEQVNWEDVWSSFPYVDQHTS